MVLTFLIMGEKGKIKKARSNCCEPSFCIPQYVNKIATIISDCNHIYVWFLFSIHFNLYMDFRSFIGIINNNRVGR